MATPLRRVGDRPRHGRFILGPGKPSAGPNAIFTRINRRCRLLCRGRKDTGPALAAAGFTAPAASTGRPTRAWQGPDPMTKAVRGAVAATPPFRLAGIPALR